MSDDQKLGIILGIVSGINMIVFGTLFIYCTIDIIKDTVKKNKKGRE